MIKTYQKRVPKFQATKFYGDPAPIIELLGVWQVSESTMSSTGMGSATLEVKLEGGRTFVIKEQQVAVRSPSGDVEIMDMDQFIREYETTEEEKSVEGPSKVQKSLREWAEILSHGHKVHDEGGSLRELVDGPQSNNAAQSEQSISIRTKPAAPIDEYYVRVHALDRAVETYKGGACAGTVLKTAREYFNFLRGE